MTRPNSQHTTVTVVVPVFNEKRSLGELYDRIRDSLETIGQPWDVVFINDGSTDGSDLELDRIADDSDGRVVVVHFRGNFGKAAALSAGFRHADGSVIITMDADLQDDPAEIERFLDAIGSGLDVVSGWKKRRHDPWHKVIPSRVFNWMVRRVSPLSLHDVNCGFKAYRKEVLEDLEIYGELHRFIPVLASWQKFRVGEIVVKHHRRAFGESKYGFARIFRGFADLLTVSFLTRFRRSPAHLFALIGSTISGAGFSICVYLSIIWLQGERPIGDRPLLLLGVLMLIVGMQFIGSGLLAELIVRGLSTRGLPYSVKRITRNSRRG